MKLYDVYKEGKQYKEKVFELYQGAFPEEEKKRRKCWMVW